MIEREKRLVVMAEEGKEPGDWYHNLWDYAQETSYPFKSQKASIANQIGVERAKLSSGLSGYHPAEWMQSV
jgi:hypothetical protein